MNKEEQNKIDCFKAFCEQDSNKVLEIWDKLQQQFKLDIPNEILEQLETFRAK